MWLHVISLFESEVVTLDANECSCSMRDVRTLRSGWCGVESAEALSRPGMGSATAQPHCCTTPLLRFPSAVTLSLHPPPSTTVSIHQYRLLSAATPPSLSPARRYFAHSLHPQPSQPGPHLPTGIVSQLIPLPSFLLVQGSASVFKMQPRTPNREDLGQT